MRHRLEAAPVSYSRPWLRFQFVKYALDEQHKSSGAFEQFYQEALTKAPLPGAKLFSAVTDPQLP